MADDLADAPIEAFDHAIGLRMAWRDESVLDTQLLTELIEHMFASRYLFAIGVLFPAGIAVRELAPVVGQQRHDFNWAGAVELAQEVSTAAIGLVGIDFHEDPACGAVDGDKQVAPRRLVGHLRQILDVDMDKSGLIILERLFFGLRAALLGNQVA